MNEFLARMHSRSRLSARERAHFTHRLSLFLRSGVPIVTALTYIRADAHNERSRALLSQITADVASGSALAAALARPARAFASFDVALVRIGEASGRLHENLMYVSELIERRRTLHARLVGVLAYPALVLTATLGIVLFLLLYAFPKILPLFRGFESTLPASTRALIALSQTVESYGWLLLGICAALGATALLMDRQPAVRLWRQYHQLRIPVIGSVLRAHELAMLSKVLGTLIGSGIGLVPALELAESATGNAAYRTLLIRTRRAVLRGRRLSDSLAAMPHLAPSLVIQIIATGERTGNLSESLLQVADIYDAEVRERSEHIAVLVEPVLMIVTGLIVGFIALSIITPIYGITQDIVV